jgi:hypothetical protein
MIKALIKNTRWNKYGLGNIECREYKAIAINFWANRLELRFISKGFISADDNIDSTEENIQINLPRTAELPVLLGVCSGPAVQPASVRIWKLDTCLLRCRYFWKSSCCWTWSFSPPLNCSNSSTPSGSSKWNSTKNSIIE